MFRSIGDSFSPLGIVVFGTFFCRFISQEERVLSSLSEAAFSYVLTWSCEGISSAGTTYGPNFGGGLGVIFERTFLFTSSGVVKAAAVDDRFLSARPIADPELFI